MEASFFASRRPVSHKTPAGSGCIRAEKTRSIVSLGCQTRFASCWKKAGNAEACDGSSIPTLEAIGFEQRARTPRPALVKPGQLGFSDYKSSAWGVDCQSVISAHGFLKLKLDRLGPSRAWDEPCPKKVKK